MGLGPDLDAMSKKEILAHTGHFTDGVIPTLVTKAIMDILNE
jgi:hypothetical protein